MLRALRISALLLAVLAIIDPALTSKRAAKPIVAVVSADSLADRALTDRVTRNLARSFTVVSAPFAGAAATVLVGDHLPVAATQLTTALFAVLPEQEAPFLILQNVQAPARAPLDARVPVSAVARVAAAPGSKVEFELRAAGVLVDRVERTVTSASDRLTVPLTFVPTATGVVPLRVSVRVGNARPAHADQIVDVREQRWSLLFFDRRPSWQSTFVRRSLERDARFIVTSRTMTSRNISTASGSPPGTLDGRSLAQFDAVVIGAPDALTASDVTALDSYLRQRAGSVVLLFDEQKRGEFERLTATGAWSNTFQNSGLTINAVDGEAGALRAAQVMWPTRLPTGAHALALDSAQRAIVWRSAVGAGQLIVSGALDAWKFRDPLRSGFDVFWPAVIGQAAESGSRALEVSVSDDVLAPGASTTVNVIVRSAALSERRNAEAVRASLTAVLESADARTPLRLWPSGPIGHFSGQLRAPIGEGVYRVLVSSDGAQASAALQVSATAQRAQPDQIDMIRALAVARGGQLLRANEAGQLPELLSRALQPAAAAAVWHPMRSPWWIVPFALLLGLEWWLRRRRGLA